jgi:hypothetical protein
LDLTGSASDAGNGSAELVEWILNGYPNPVHSHTYFAGQAGVSSNVFMSIKEREGDTLLLPVYNHIHYGIPTSSYDPPPEDEVVISNGASSTYYHVIAFSCFVPMCVKVLGSDYCPLWHMGRQDGSIKRNDKTVEGYFTECGSSDIISPGDYYAGAYFISLIR